MITTWLPRRHSRPWVRVQWQRTGATEADSPQGFIRIKTELSEADYERLKARFLLKARRQKA